jgi:transketolase
MSSFEQAIRTIQFLSVDGVEKAKSGHPGTPMALAGITTELFSRTLRYNPEDPAWPNRDRFVLSCGHASMLLYSVLHLAGYPVSKDDLRAFRQWHSKTPGHPENFETPGVETTTGPLGQGVGNAVGMALAGKLLAARVNTESSKLIDYRVFVLASDGDIMEGVASEASSIAGHLGLGNLKVIYDDNRITIDGSTDISFSEDVAKRYEGYGWAVQKVDGHDVEAVRKAIAAAVAETSRPSLIIARTHIAIGAPTKQDSSEAHGSPLGKAEIEATKRNAGWPLEPDFITPDEAYEVFRQRVAAVKPEYDAWQKAVASLPADRARAWQSFTRNETSGDLLDKLLEGVEPTALSTRDAAGKIEQKVAALVPRLIGGSADLDGSTMTFIKGATSVSRTSFEGRNLHFGIREHGMGAIANGLALSGFLPFTATFLIFSDYMRPPIRLAALMKLQAVHVFTHDSIFLGEDGPTHQPIEQLNSLRLIPNLHVIRPADLMECAAAWAHAVARKDGPTLLALTRQKLPALERPAGFDPKQILRGAYVLSDAEDPTLVVIATGSEVALALGAKKILEQKGQRVRVVSAPCLEAFKALPNAERASVLGTGIRRVSIEAGTTELWRSIVGLDGITIGIDTFGASAPLAQLAEGFGFTPEKVAARILSEL